MTWLWLVIVVVAVVLVLVLYTRFSSRLAIIVSNGSHSINHHNGTGSNVLQGSIMTTLMRSMMMLANVVITRRLCRDT